MRRLCRVMGVLAAAGLFAASFVATAPTAAAAPKPYIGGFGVEYAPAHKYGAVVLPWMGCDGDGRNDATVTNTRTKKAISRSWMFGQSYVSVPPGTYRVSIVAVCNGARNTYTGTRTVKRETDANTVSKAEFKRLKRGMTVKQVKRIVGTAGLKFGSTRLLDHRGNFDWAELNFRRGKLASKWWHAELGDNSVR